MMKFGVLLFAMVFVALTGWCKDKGRGESVSSVKGEMNASAPENAAGYAMTSRDLVKRTLEGMGIQVGCDAERGRIVATATHGCSLKHEEPDEELGFTETYDFPEDTADDFETRRFKAVWKAYADALAEIATQLGTSIEHEEEKDDEGRVQGETSHSRASCSLAGVAFLTMAESFKDGWYEVSVAVGQSKKREEAYSRGVTGGESRSGKYSLAEWVEVTVDKGAGGIICPQSYCDNEDVWWRVAGVPVELDDGNYSKKVLLVKKAKRYAYEAAMRTLAVRVSTSTSLSVKLGAGKGNDIKEKVERTVKIEPVNTVLPVSQVQWFEVEKVDAFTGKPVRCIVAALRSGKESARAERKAKVGNGSSQNGTAVEQAKAYLEQKGWRTGRDFLKSSSFVVAIGGSAFKCTPAMGGAAFAQKRNEAVQLALMEAAMNVAFTYDTDNHVSKMTMGLSRNGENESTRMERNYVGEEADGIIVRGGITFSDDIDTEVDLKNKDFQWYAGWASLLTEESGEVEKKAIKTLGQVKGKMPVCEFKVERQFESIVDGKYQVAFVVTHDPKRGVDTIRAFDRESICGNERGKLSLQQWIETQDFGMMAGPRRYVDDKGNVWAIGIAPAAGGCRPFGSSIDEMARKYAAFAFGGDMEASYEMKRFASSSGEFLERKARVFYTAETTPAGRCYPKEFEFVFHRPFTHPLTGLNGVVSICALRSGTRELVDKQTAERIKEACARTKERKRKEAIRDSLLEKEKGSFQ